MLTVRGQADAAELRQQAADGLADNGEPSTADAAAAAGRWWQLRNWRLSSKLIIVLLVPSLSTLVLAGLRLSSQLDDARQFAGIRQELALASNAAAVTDALQGERDGVVSYLAGRRSESMPRFDQSDAAVDRLREVSANSDGVVGPVREAVDRALAGLSALGALRNSALTTRLPDTAALTSYTEIINSLTAVNRIVATNVSNPALTPLTGSLQSLSDAKEQLALQNAIVVSAARHREFPPDQANALRAAQARFDAEREEFANAASADNRQLLADVVSGPSVDERNRQVQLALVQSDAGQPVTVVPNSVEQLGNATVGLFMKVITNIGGQADAAVGDLVGAARANAFRDGALVVVALLIALGLTLYVARSMLVPLRVLRRSALEMARTKLPAAIERILHDREAAGQAVEPVPVHSTEEVGQVARAFDAVQSEAVRLATEQAALRSNVNAMFVNLSRRSQALVERQISVIDRLEQDEQDPDQLASLFELDHLATQMRRNSENLLVLAGTSLARRVTRPVPVAEVMGAAVSEVEKYARVQVAPAPELTIQGRAVNDLTHLVAELLDNATAFSPPSTKVTVRTARMRRGELAIEIHDRGVGMAEEELAAANERLADPPEVDVTASRQMGLFVVAQLAKRHDVRVRLRNNDDIEGGVTAHVVVPANLVGVADPQATPLPPAGLPRRPATSEPPTAISTSGVGLIAPQPAAPPAPEPAEPPTQGMDLFAPRPKKDAAVEPATPNASDNGFQPWPAPQPRQFDYDDPPTERLPIYEEVLSQWFQITDEETPAAQPVRPPRQAPVQPPVAEEGTRHQPEPEPQAQPKPEPQPQPEAKVAAEPAAVDAELPSAPPDSVPEPRTAAAEPVQDRWQSPADEGWRAAQALLEQVPDGVTQAGLPKRVPKANLVPGSASARPQQPQQNRAPAKPRRSPDALRERLATYQRGVTLGRHSMSEDNAASELDAGYSDARPKEQE
ncbi:nitrate- and nitrite sensing domain-containing protein [Kutzneria viridogrisea]|uniref:sensor histidine kinase n=1 Tax=Kutzneria viridogrisea TaxID=47990 RepID=UPI0033718364